MLQNGNALEQGAKLLYLLLFLPFRVVPYGLAVKIPGFLCRVWTERETLDRARATLGGNTLTTEKKTNAKL